MYQIYADNTLIYDSTLEDYKIGKGEVTLEAGKSGSFVFSVYPAHFYYEQFVKLKTVVTVYKSGRIVFRGRILNDVTDYWNNKVITCEGELGFLNDTIVRPFSFQGGHVDLFADLIEQHNEQVDEFKRFKVGTVTVTDENDYVNRSNTDYSPTLSVLAGALTDSALGGHFYVTHGDDGTDPIPTIHYLADFTKESSQPIEFGSNLKDYVKTVKAEELATALIPLGTSNSSEGHRLTVESVNNGRDYIYSPEGVALYGWVFKTAVWEDVTLANHLMTKAQAYLEAVVNQNITIELNAIDLHLLDRSIESFEVCSYVPVVSAPHKLNAVMLCHKQTMNLLQPENDTIVLGYQTASFTGASTQVAASISTLGKKVSSVAQDAESIRLTVESWDTDVDAKLDEILDATLDEKLSAKLELTAEEIRSEISAVRTTLNGQIGNVSDQQLDNLLYLDGRIDTEVANLNSSISQTATAIRSDVTAELATFKKGIEEGIEEDVEAALSSSIEQSASAIKTEVKAEIDSDIRKLWGSIDANTEGVLDLLGKYNSLGSTVEQTSSSISAIVTGVGSNGTVSAASIVAAINRAGSSVKINADHVTVDASSIDLTGVVKMSDLSTEGRTTINGSNITTGTIRGINFVADTNLNTTGNVSNSFVVEDGHGYTVGKIGYAFFAGEYDVDTGVERGDKLYLITEKHTTNNGFNTFLPAVKIHGAGGVSIETDFGANPVYINSPGGYITLASPAIHIRDNVGTEWRFADGRLYKNDQIVL